MVINIYHEKDGDLSILKDKVIAVIGYGNQGRSQALNLRDSGLNVIIGNRDDEYKERAKKDGFDTYNIVKAVTIADFIFLLIPDELAKDICEKEIFPNLVRNNSLIFASGYNIAFNLIQPPEYVDILLIAPRMIGIGVRECFLNKKGYFSFIGVHQDASGYASSILLALAKGIGGLMKAGIEITFKQEAVLDLFTEQGYGPAFGQVLLNSINTLIEAGYPPEAVLVELVLSGEMSYTYEKMAEVGVVKQMNFHSQTSQYGSLSRGVKFRKVSNDIKKIQSEVLKNIENGEFAREWESKTSKLKFKLLKFFASRIGFAKIEKKVRRNLDIPEVDLFMEIPYPKEEDLKKNKKIQKEIEDFKDFYMDF